MKKIRSNSYEAQLTADELQALHAILSEPGSNLKQVQHRVPAWRSGPFAGAKPSLPTLGSIAARLWAEQRLAETQTTDLIMRAVARKFQPCPGDDPDLIDSICRLISQDLLRNILMRGSPFERIAQFRLLLKRQDQLLALGKARDAFHENATEPSPQPLHAAPRFQTPGFRACVADDCP